MNSNEEILTRLRRLNLTNDQAKLYLELLRGPNTHLKLAHATGINRTKVYRLASDLQKRSLISVRSDDRGTFLVAADPATLEVEIVTQEEKVKKQRSAFELLMPDLVRMKARDETDFVIQTYDGSEGFKQMLWHELKTEGECLVFGSGSIDDLVSDAQWAEKHRALTVQTNYHLREILNPRTKKPIFTLNETFIKQFYKARIISRSILPLGQQLVIYNDTVAIYNWREERKVGVEIINKAYAHTMRSIFNHYWELAEEQAPPK